MKKTDLPKFKFVDITMPRINCIYLSEPTNDKLSLLYRVDGLIKSDTKFQILFGNKINSEERVDSKTPKVQITIEALAEFEFEEPLPKYEKLSDVPFVANMLAVMYPYIREKVSYCFNANHSQYLLDPVNTFRLLADNKDSFQLTDARENAKAEDKSEKQTES